MNDTTQPREAEEHRKAMTEHRVRIESEVCDALAKLDGIGSAIAVLEAIRDGEIPHVRIDY